MAAQQPTPDEALAEMRDILRSAAAEGVSQRLPAIRYTMCRQTLMESELRPVLPGFLIQCLTYSKFHDFIHLYHPNVDRRLALIDAEFPLRPGSSPAVPRPRFDIFDDTAS